MKIDNDARRFGLWWKALSRRHRNICRYAAASLVALLTLDCSPAVACVLVVNFAVSVWWLLREVKQP